MGYHNRDHRERRVISKHKFIRIYEENLNNAGVAYRRVKGKTQTSSVAVKINNIVYALFSKQDNDDLKEDICIRYYLKDNKGLDSIAFSKCSSHLLAYTGLIWKFF